MRGRTKQQERDALVAMVNAAYARGWSHVDGWFFECPNGVTYDLSATDLTKLNIIEAQSNAE